MQPSIMATIRSKCEECGYDTSLTWAERPLITLDKLNQRFEEKQKSFEHKHKLVFTRQIEVLV